MANALRHSTVSGLVIASLATVASVAASAAEVTVDIRKMQFLPFEITINKGDTVVWVNREKRQYHNVWFEQLGEEEGDYFWPEETFSRTFDNSGSYPYRCGPHPKMTGVVHVK